jgi:NADH-quinone oxidoreductase subunit J
LSLVVCFFGIAAHYFLLRAEFLGVAQILIYIGAVAVLILFAIMLTRHVTGMEGPRELGGKWWMGASTAGIIGVLLWWCVRREVLTAMWPSSEKAQGLVAVIGKALVSEWVVPFEALAVLLTAALVGAVVIALEEVVRKR